MERIETARPFHHHSHVFHTWRCGREEADDESSLRRSLVDLFWSFGGGPPVNIVGMVGSIQKNQLLPHSISYTYTKLYDLNSSKRKHCRT